jgi:hypothetical protein
VKKCRNRKIRDKYADGDIDTCYNSLCLAIIEQAVRDYTKALKAEMKCGGLNARRVIRELETFFKSDWFAQISNLDGRLLIKNVREIILN